MPINLNDPIGDVEMKPEYEIIYDKYMDEAQFLDMEARNLKAANYRMDLLRTYTDVAVDDTYLDTMGKLYEMDENEEVLFLFTSNYIQTKEREKL